ncbi:MAG: hypothetical protein ACE5EW_01525 [Thermoplasmata archaeon]
MVDLVALTLRYLHIAFGIAWIGAVAYGVGVLRVALPRADPPASQAVLRHLIPVAIRYIPFAGAMTILFGAVLYLYIGSFDARILVGSLWGLLLLAALILSLGAFVYGLVWGIGSARRLLTHLEEEACSHREEVMGLQRRFNRVQIGVLFVGLLIIGLMVYVVQAF